MSDVCTKTAATLDEFPMFDSDTLLAFEGANADEAIIGILNQLIPMPKESHPDAIHTFNYTGNDYTLVVDNVYLEANDVFGQPVEVYSADASLIMDEEYQNLIVNAYLFQEFQNAGSEVPYSKIDETLALIYGADGAEIVKQGALTLIKELAAQANVLGTVACQYDYPYRGPGYEGLLAQCNNGEIPTYSWFSKGNVYLNFKDGLTDVPKTCQGMSGMNPNGCAPELVPEQVVNEFPVNAVALSDRLFLAADKLGEDGNCYVEAHVVSKIALVVQETLPFCGTQTESKMLQMAMIGYYWGKQFGGLGTTFCTDQSKEFLTADAITSRSACDDSPCGCGNPDLYVKPCALMNAYDFGFSYGEDGKELECMFGNIDYSMFDDCTTDPDTLTLVLTEPYDPVNTTLSCGAVPVPDSYADTCQGGGSAAAGGLPMMTLYATAFLWVLKKFTF